MSKQPLPSIPIVSPYAQLPPQDDTDAEHSTADLPRVDTAPLQRTLGRLERGELDIATLNPVLGRELSTLRSQIDALQAHAHHIAIELRKARESSAKGEFEREEQLRSIQDENDKFVAQLIADHEAEAQALRRERDSAIERVRELSRGMSRVGTVSMPSLRRVSLSNVAATSPTQEEVAQLKARVDELCFERERSLKLLRQLAEQRDDAENRLQQALVRVSPPETGSTSSRDSRGASLPVAPTCDGVTRALGGPSIELLADSPPSPVSGPSPAIAAAASAVLADSAVVRTAHVVSSAAAPSGGDTLDWDLSTPEKSPGTSALVKAMARDDFGEVQSKGERPAGSSEPSIPLLRKKSLPGLERAGAYSVSASEIPVEEVVLTRVPHVQKDR
ncbi:MAG: hypothetical protein QM784_13085 [Polyangiaceae bacterium]